MNLPCAVAQILAGVAEERALSIGVPVAVAFADAQGLPLFFSRMEGTLPAASDIALNKAYTAAALRVPTHELGLMSQPGQSLYGIQNLWPGRIVLFGGGFPILLDGHPAGGIGISGGTVAEDMDIAHKALQALEAMEAWAEALAPELCCQQTPRWTALSLLTTISAAFEAHKDIRPEHDERIIAGGVLLALERNRQQRSSNW
ncbi:GlcG/HbpS family heme-binding protein [Desulfosoma sp.]